MVKLIEHPDHIELILNRPEALNAFSTPMLKEIAAALAEAEAGAATVMVMRGEGRAFCVGADVKERQKGMSLETYLMERVMTLQKITSVLRGTDKVIIAVLHGHVIGGGLVMSLYADLRIAAAGTSFRLPEVDVGSTMLGGGYKVLTECVGACVARELLLLGEPVSSERAERIGLINCVVPPDELHAVVARYVEKLSAKNPVVLKLIKRAAARVPDTGFEEMQLREIMDACFNHYSASNKLKDVSEG
jgi:enoyl-CoA hydratase/carnithine racemase